MLHLSNAWPRGWFWCAQSHSRQSSKRLIKYSLWSSQNGRGVRRRRGARGPTRPAAARLRLRPRQQGHDTRAIQGWLGHRSITGTAVYTTPGAEPVQGFRAVGGPCRRATIASPPLLTALASKPGRPIESDPAQTRNALPRPKSISPLQPSRPQALVPSTEIQVQSPQIAA
jgi:hypothetical protein